MMGKAKGWQFFLLVFLIATVGGVVIILILVFSGGGEWLANQLSLPTVFIPKSPPAKAGFTPILYASVTVPSPIPSVSAGMIPTSTRTKVPTRTVRSTNIPEDGESNLIWKWVNLDTLNLQLEMPASWSIQENASGLKCEPIGGVLARYVLTGPSSDYLEIYISCLSGITVRVGPCYDYTVIDKKRQIYREFAPAPLTVYSKLETYNGEIQCPMLGWDVAGKSITGAYYNRTTFTTNFPLVDRIMLSIRGK